PAQTAKFVKINFRNAGLAKIFISKGKIRSNIDLSRDVAGCNYVSREQKRELDKTDCASSPATFKLIDATVKNSQTFLVIQSNAMGNCNVCGQCGASEAYTLIWLKLNPRLRVINKQSIPLNYCLAGISIKDVKQLDNLSGLQLS